MVYSYIKQPIIINTIIQLSWDRLVKYDFESHAYKDVILDLSGGYKSRDVLVERFRKGLILFFLIWKQTIDAVVKVITEMDGRIIVVTHDHYLIEQCGSLCVEK